MQVLFEHLQNATQLTKLVIGRKCYWRSNIFEKLNSKLKYTPHITILRIQYICTPEIISDLSENCPQLCELSVKGSEKITDEECEKIARCSELTCLDISGTRITGKGCWKILESAKKLSWLHHCAFNCNSDALLFESRADLFNCIRRQLLHGQSASSLVDQQELLLKEVRFNLKNFWLFNPFTEDLLATILCPQLEYLRLDFVFQDLEEEPDVDMLSSLPQVSQISFDLHHYFIISSYRLMNSD